MKKILSLLVLVLLSCMGAWAQYTWKGGTTINADSWNSAANWETTATITTLGPGIAQSNLWDEIRISDVESGTVPQLEGWNFRMVANHSVFEIEDMNKIQGNESMYLTLKNGSNVTMNFNQSGHTQTLNINLGEGNNTFNFVTNKGYAHSCGQAACNNATIAVNYGNVTADMQRVANFSVSDDQAHTIKNVSINATLPNIYSEATEFHKLKVATVGANVTVTNLSYNISGTGYSLSDVELTEVNKEENVGKYFYEKDGDGNVWLSWVTGNRRFFSVTYTFPALDGSTFTSTVDLEDGTNANDACPAIEFFNKTGLAGNGATVSSTNLNFTVQGSWSFPLEFNRVMRLHGHDHGKWLVYESDSKATYQNSADGFRKDCYWYFTYAGMTSENKVKVYLHTLVNDKKVTLANTNSGTQASLGNGTELVYVTNGNGFSLAHPSNQNACLNNYQNGGILKIWNDNLSPADNGSRFHIKADQFDTDLSALTTISGDDASLVLGARSFTVDATKKTQAISTKAPADVKALFINDFANEVDLNAVYTMQMEVGSRKISAVPYANAAGENLAGLDIKNSTQNTIADLWAFESDGANGYYIKHVNSGKYVGNASRSATVNLSDTKVSYSVIKYSLDNKKQGLVLTSNKSMYLNTNGNISNLVGWDGSTVENSDGSRATLTKVTSLPFTFNAATAYATFCSPVNLEIPSGVSAYIATSVHGDEGLSSSDDFLFIEQLTGYIPANTGVLLIGTPGATVNFPIAADAVLPNVEANKFVGTTVERRGFTEDSHYGLRLYNDEAVLAKNGTVANVPANKAILPVDAVSASSNVLGFRFGEDVLTSIKSATTTNNIEFYDLNGKRVKNPTTGIYVTRDGRKVFVK